MGARPLSPIFPSGHHDRRPDLAPVTRLPRLTEVRYRDGCRGFAGPIPPPLWMRYSVFSQGRTPGLPDARPMAKAAPSPGARHWCLHRGVVSTVTDQAADPATGLLLDSSRLVPYD